MSECLGKVKATMGRKEAEKVSVCACGAVSTGCKTWRRGTGGRLWRLAVKEGMSDEVLMEVNVGTAEYRARSIRNTGRCEFSIESGL